MYGNNNKYGEELCFCKYVERLASHSAATYSPATPQKKKVPHAVTAAISKSILAYGVWLSIASSRSSTLPDYSTLRIYPC